MINTELAAAARWYAFRAERIPEEHRLDAAIVWRELEKALGGPSSDAAALSAIRRWKEQVEIALAARLLNAPLKQPSPECSTPRSRQKRHVEVLALPPASIQGPRLWSWAGTGSTRSLPTTCLRTRPRMGGQGERHRRTANKTALIPRGCQQLPMTNQRQKETTEEMTTSTPPKTESALDKLEALDAIATKAREKTGTLVEITRPRSHDSGSWRTRGES